MNIIMAVGMLANGAGVGGIGEGGLLPLLFIIGGVMSLGWAVHLLNQGCRKNLPNRKY